MKNFKKIVYVALAFAPAFAFAQSQSLGNVTNLITALIHIVNILIPAAFALAILFFFYGIALYVLAAGDAEKAKEGKSIMIYGVIAIAVMASIYGLVAWLQTAFGINGQTPTTGNITPPTVNGIQ
jgi:hypothetical protein